MALSEMSQEVLKRADAIGVWASGSLDKIGEGVGKVSQIAYEQAIDIAHQYIMFGTVYLTCIVLLGFVIIGFAGWCWYVLAKTDDGDIGSIAFFGGLFASIIGLIIILNNFKEMIMVWFAPKMWIIIQLAELAKDAKTAIGH